MIGEHACRRCKNFFPEEDIFDEWKCNAFPNGIPYEHFTFMNNFNPPKNCNNGIGYEKKIENNPKYIVPKKYSDKDDDDE